MEPSYDYIVLSSVRGLDIYSLNITVQGHSRIPEDEIINSNVGWQ